MGIEFRNKENSRKLIIDFTWIINQCVFRRNILATWVFENILDIIAMVLDGRRQAVVSKMPIITASSED